MATSARLTAIDTLRGLVIVLMVLDHVRDYFTPSAIDPTDLAHTSPALFWTRWITHLCAPTFVLLAGCAAWLRGQRCGSIELARYLATRGFLLLLLEATWISFCWQFAYQVIILQVLFALGAGMIFLSVLLQLPRWLIGAIGALLILPHNLFDAWTTPDLFWRAWHLGGYYPLGAHFGIVFVYPLMPWLGLIALGYTLGPVFAWTAARRQRLLLGLATGLLAVFLALRLTHVYGDPQRYAPTGLGPMYDLMAFVNLQKYPPSLLYLCLTLAIALALLAWFERLPPLPVLTLFGRHPLLLYASHIALVHLLANAYFALRYGAQPVFDADSGQLHLPPGYTAALWPAYLAWPAVLALLYGALRLLQAWRGRRPDVR
ncbi:DUF1624 domain-containing protein [Massilia sp. TS11]|uniref:DUF1624 domain-containing protein n=1 Tax=Massilia sp. TS11 TaxID=2908003 RepID=UPI001EDAEA84|nr:heparan-alpha-glucosaminide N-acetyltransferase domain-containing protein [Massilia sp. TS11]MCG2584843.1 heparan-alpha-glucosaminide N-acetyltransferase domain-containing protein [Massilia sp. TS11]